MLGKNDLENFRFRVRMRLPMPILSRCSSIIQTMDFCDVSRTVHASSDPLITGMLDVSMSASYFLIIVVS